VLGVLKDTTGSTSGAFLGLAALALIASALCFRLRTRLLVTPASEASGLTAKRPHVSRNDPRHPLADEVARDRHAEPDDEHV